ncbi:MAG: 1-hydroxy-2-methyl-2-(E)-butenyl 4-diphosphate synthase [Actinomycetales bacterium]|nr:1-hydroxy-2-methyl-2-(E)-butenyl 4-diphosphate synthase [Actinomycetales bacterium]
MRRSRRWAERLARRLLADDGGSATLEFLTVGLLLLVPTVYLVLALAAVQAGAFGVEGAARQAARVYVQAGDVGAANAAAERAVAVTLADYGLDAGGAEVSVSCRPDPGDCLRRHGFVTVRVSARVSLPLAPPVLSLQLPVAIPLSSVATEQVSRFAGSR